MAGFRGFKLMEIKVATAVFQGVPLLNRPLERILLFGLND